MKTLVSVLNGLNIDGSSGIAVSRSFSEENHQDVVIFLTGGDTVLF